MMKVMKGKKGRTASKTEYDTREGKLENIYTINFDTDNITNIEQLRTVIIDNIKVDCKRVNSNEYISFVISPPISKELFSALLLDNKEMILAEKQKAKIKAFQLANEFITNNFPDTKACIVLHENQSVPHSHVLVSPKTLTGETVRIENLKDLRHKYNDLLKRDFSEELKFFEERKERNEVLEPVYYKKKDFIEKANGKRETFDDLIKSIVNSNYSSKTIDEAFEKVKKFKYDEFQKQQALEEIEYYKFANEIKTRHEINEK